MNYQFPVINNISQVLPLIKDKPEFIVAVKDGGYTVVNYVVQTAETFPPVVTESDAMLRELRGMIFNTATGEVLARRLHKFFNVNERDETQVQKIDFSQPHVILEKLDGSMITPVWTEQGLRWGTKMGVTQVALPVEEFLVGLPQYEALAHECRESDVTPIFEWTSRKQRIVIDYPEDQLVLIAVRRNSTGKYKSHKLMQQCGEKFNIPVVKAYEGNVQNMHELIEQTGPMVGCEGFVVRFNTGHMIKVKAEDYIRKHSAKDMIGREKNIIELLVTEKLDDVKAFLDAADLERIQDFELKFWRGVNVTAHKLVELRCSFPMEIDRKTYAVDFVQKQEPQYSRFLYAMHNLQPGDNTFAMVKDAIASSCGTQARVDDVRWMFNCNWNAATSEE
jgi:RNA ligase